MATATETKAAPRKRAAKKAAAAAPTNGKAPARRGRPPKAAEVVEEEFEEEVETETQTSVARREAAERREERRAAKEELCENIAALRQEGKTWAEISEEVDLDTGICQLRYFEWEYRQEDGGDPPEATPESVKEDRDNGISWARIMAKYDISRLRCWALLEEAGVDHYDSDIGKGGRFINRDPDEVEARREAKKAARKASKAGTNGDDESSAPRPRRRGRPPKFKGFTDETPHEDVLDAVEGKKITWKLTRGDGTDSAVPKPGTVEVVTDKRGQRGIKFSDGRKSRTVYVNKIIEIS